ncbi:MAG: hypothetical protein HQL53_13255, partial [Magnetococcales bacterium]|nr:hypothetical protein [Magnetococcales bacterium]
MTDGSASQERGKRVLLHEAILESWVAFAAFTPYLVLNLFYEVDARLLGALALVTVLLAMNGLSKTELWFGLNSRVWWRQHPVMRRFHHIHEEGEMAGIFVALVVGVFMTLRGVHLHFPYNECFTLFGIMSAANLAVRQMLPIMSYIERTLGKWMALWLGSLLSSLTGEPAAAVFLTNFIKERIAPEDAPRVATKLGATIGSGGGLMPFAAPPVLIVWGM